MDLRAEEKAGQGHKQGLPEIDVSEWEITYTKTCPREGKRSCNTSKTTQLPANETLPRTAKRAKKNERKRLRLIKKAHQQISKPGSFHRICVTNVDNPDITDVIVQITNIRFRTSEQLSVLKTSTRVFKESQIRLTLWVTPLSQNHSSHPLVISNLRTRFFLRGVDCDTPGF
jgi:hypothetical protein